jgi:phosphoglucomutase
MDAGRLSICGEESFGTGSDHIREKDGLWAVVGASSVAYSYSFTYTAPLRIAWLNIIAAANEQDKSGKLWGIREILNRHYAKYGRSFFSRYDYEEVPSEGAQKLVDHVNGLINSSSFSSRVYTSSATGTSFTVANAYNFNYTDPIDKSISKNQGQVVTFSDGSRVVWRLSGTGSQGATVRMYVERYVAPEAGDEELARDTGEGLQALIDVALEISNLREFLGREQPTVITVSDMLFSSKRKYTERTWP